MFAPKYSVFGRAALLRAVVVLALCAMGCSSSNREGSSGDLGFGGSGSNIACENWQESYCDLNERCGLAVKSECLAQAQTIACRSDVAAEACATELDSASCPSAPPGCSFTEMADPEPARRACVNFIDAFCEVHTERCDNEYPITKTECINANLNSGGFCTGVIGVKPGYQDCMTALENYPCGVSGFPDACNGIFIQQ